MLFRTGGILLRHRFPVAIIVGVPGVGKSTLIDLSRRRLSEAGYRVVVLNYGDYMLKRLSSLGLVRDRDDIRRLPIRIQVENQAEAARMMIEDAGKELSDSKGVLIIDTHLLIRTTTGYWPGLPLHVAQELKPDTIILIEARPEEIIARQEKDQRRRRKDYSDPRIVQEIQEMNRIEALVVATLTGATVSIIQNREGEAEKAAEELAKTLQSLIR
jgi:adenylate kinase